LDDIILHHYPTSTFSERVRLAFGLKGLTWRSVTIPAAMPKPDLLPLTGGYRRTPVMQIGADVYCDTQLILRKIERLHPEPSLYPDGSEGFVMVLAYWADQFIFSPALGVVADTIAHKIPADFVAERKAFGFPLAREDVAPVLHRHLQQGAAHLAWLDKMLFDGRPFLFYRPSAADFAIYCPLWLLRNQGGPEAEAKLPLNPLRAWYDRVTAIGHGHPLEMSSSEALAVAANSEPRPLDINPHSDPSGLRAGDTVIVAADDTGRDPIGGTLLAADAEELVIRSSYFRVGAINIHFPRAGFDVVAAHPR
jgi:glutathione S-transferase